MKTKLLTFLCLLLTWGTSSTMGQTDVTDLYLLNANFDDEETFDYSVNSTGNVAQEILEIDGWTKDIGIDYTITGIYAVGTKTTFFHSPLFIFLRICAHSVTALHPQPLPPEWVS